MRRSLLRLWLGTSLLGSLLAYGCQHARQSCPTCGPSASRVAAAPAVSKVYGYAPSKAVPSSSEESSVVPAPYEEPVVHTAAKPIVPTSAEPAAPDAPAITAVEAGGGPTALSPYRERTVARRTFTDLTAHPKFAHDANYHWLVGTVDYSRSRVPGCCATPPLRRRTATAAPWRLRTLATARLSRMVSWCVWKAMSSIPTARSCGPHSMCRAFAPKRREITPVLPPAIGTPPSRHRLGGFRLRFARNVNARNVNAPMR